MRTTITIDDVLLAEVKVLAARSHRSVGSVLEDALRAMLARSQETSTARPLSLTTSGTPHGRELVDILDREALAEAVGDNTTAR